jgi:hypothetical protein
MLNTNSGRNLMKSNIYSKWNVFIRSSEKILFVTSAIFRINASIINYYLSCAVHYFGLEYKLL